MPWQERWACGTQATPGRAGSRGAAWGHAGSREGVHGRARTSETGPQCRAWSKDRECVHSRNQNGKIWILEPRVHTLATSTFRHRKLTAPNTRAHAPSPQTDGLRLLRSPPTRNRPLAHVSQLAAGTSGTHLHHSATSTAHATGPTPSRARNLRYLAGVTCLQSHVTSPERGPGGSASSAKTFSRQNRPPSRVRTSDPWPDTEHEPHRRVYRAA